MADVIFKPEGISLTIFDYDVDDTGPANSQLSKDPDGAECCILEWSGREKVLEHQDWPIVKHAVRNTKTSYSRRWKCSQCGRTTESSYEELAESGTPYCADCDQEMQIV